MRERIPSRKAHRQGAYEMVRSRARSRGAARARPPGRARRDRPRVAQVEASRGRSRSESLLTLARRSLTECGSLLARSETAGCHISAASGLCGHLAEWDSSSGRVRHIAPARGRNRDVSIEATLRHQSTNTSQRSAVEHWRSARAVRLTGARNVG